MASSAQTQEDRRNSPELNFVLLFCDRYSICFFLENKNIFFFKTMSASAQKKEKLAPWREPEHAKGHITGTIE
jgi:hypothetical protein